MKRRRPILFSRKTERVLEHLQAQNRENGVKTLADSDEELPVEKGDVLAMTIAAFITIFPVLILVLAVLIGLPLLILWLLGM